MMQSCLTDAEFSVVQIRDTRVSFRGLASNGGESTHFAGTLRAGFLASINKT